MRFSVVVALMAAASVSARAIPRAADIKALQARAGTLEVRAQPVAVVKQATPAAAAKAPKKAKKAKKSKSSASSDLGSASASNSSSVDVSASASNSSSADASSASAAAAAAASAAASSTSTANSATRTRPCDQGDQSLASSLTSAVTIGLGQQAAVLTAQGTNNTADFATAVTRLQQFVTTAGLQLQTAQAIADDDSFAQTQLKLLAASQTSQETAVAALSAGDATTNAAALTDLVSSFATSTDNAQDGAEQALIDCFLPLNTLSG